MATPDVALCNVLIDCLLDEFRSRGFDVLSTDNLIPVTIKGIQFLNTVTRLTGLEKQALLITALQKLVELALTHDTKIDVTIIKGVVESPLAADIITSICSAAKGHYNLGKPWGFRVKTWFQKWMGVPGPVGGAKT